MKIPRDTCFLCLRDIREPTYHQGIRICKSHVRSNEQKDELAALLIPEKIKDVPTVAGRRHLVDVILLNSYLKKEFPRSYAVKNKSVRYTKYRWEKGDRLPRNSDFLITFTRGSNDTIASACMKHHAPVLTLFENALGKEITGNCPVVYLGKAASYGNAVSGANRACGNCFENFLLF